MTKMSPPSRQPLVVLTADDVDKFLPELDLEAALQCQADVFTSFSAPDQDDNPQGGTSHGGKEPEIQTPHRLTVSSDDQTMLFMPSRVKAAGGTAAKIVSVPSGGGADGLPASTILMDEKTGKVRAIVNARKLTALRNACGSALFLQRLPSADSPKRLLIFGSGAQAEAHASVLLRLWPSIKEVTFAIRQHTPRSASLVISLLHRFPAVTFTVGVASSSATSQGREGTNPDMALDLQQAVHNANIIVTATSSTTALFNSVDVTSGTRIILIGSYKPHMREVEDDLVRRAGIVVVDSREACAQEAGELISAGLSHSDMTELGQLLWTGPDGDAAVARIRKAGDVAIFKSVGLGIQDVAIANLVLSEASRLRLGTLVPDYD